MMKRFGTTTRIAFAMAMWSAVVLLTLRMTGVLEDGHQRRIAHRTRLCEVVGVNCSQLASRPDREGIEVALQSLVSRHDEVLSAACRTQAGEIVAVGGDHDALWSDESRANRVFVNVYDGSQVWGKIEVAFEPLIPAGPLGVLSLPSVRVIALAVIANLIGFSWMLRRCFRRLDPTSAIPDRVRSALDTMSELVLVLDDNHRVMLANRATSELFGRSLDQMQGVHVESLPWSVETLQTDGATAESTHDGLVECLINRPLAESEPAPVQLSVNGQQKTLKPNASSIQDADGIEKGVLLTLNDISILSSRTEQLRETMRELEASRSEIEEQNIKLKYLATRDPLTGCLNRRSFFESAEDVWTNRHAQQLHVSCIMCDIDHFKSINDEFGHGVGDKVLRQVSHALQQTMRDDALVCRFGGEEFCLLVPQINVQQAAEVAERVRATVEQLEIEERDITISVGYAITHPETESIQTLIEQADEALYRAKNNGRNQVADFDKCRETV